jgi:hypothetical protein
MPREIDARRGKDPAWHQEALLGEPTGVGAFDHHVELIVKAAAIKPLGRGGDAEDAGLGHGGQHLGPCAGDCVVGLVDDQQLEKAGWDGVKPPGEGLDGCHLNRVAEVHAVAIGDDPVLAADGVEAAAGLIHQLLTVNQDADPVAADGRLLGDVDECVGLAAAGGENEQDAAVAGHVGAADLGDGIGLEWAERDHG